MLGGGIAVAGGGVHMRRTVAVAGVHRGLLVDRGRAQMRCGSRPVLLSGRLVRLVRPVQRFGGALLGPLGGLRGDRGTGRQLRAALLEFLGAGAGPSGPRCG